VLVPLTVGEFFSSVGGCIAAWIRFNFPATRSPLLIAGNHIVSASLNGRCQELVVFRVAAYFHRNSSRYDNAFLGQRLKQQCDFILRHPPSLENSLARKNSPHFFKNLRRDDQFEESALPRAEY